MAHTVAGECDKDHDITCDILSVAVLQRDDGAVWHSALV